MFELNTILRENIKKLVPYSSARDEYKGKKGIFLDANENAFGSPVFYDGNVRLNRYPDPLQLAVKEKLGKIKGLPIENIFLGNGSDEAIDILFRAFCNPGKDNVIVCPPTYGMYEVSANINDVEVIKVPLLSETFQLDESNIFKSINDKTKLIFICCPNNPTGNGVVLNTIKKILDNFKGIVVIDEAYINFAGYRSLISELTNYPNLVILQTLSKAWGLAGLRVGMAFAAEQIIDVFNKIKPPYNINSVSQELVINALEKVNEVNDWIKTIVLERERISFEIGKLTFVKKVYKSEANFILLKVENAQTLYYYLTQNQIVVRDRSKVILCENCLRITIGTKQENEKLMSILNKFNK
ncbi:MAG TPA: histidinol-phosphate transaminase [Bacteroidia bacterium]|nr:histidinol-phosphate transaminase [Bacteroidia bacterium]